LDLLPNAHYFLQDNSCSNDVPDRTASHLLFDPERRNFFSELLPSLLMLQAFLEMLSALLPQLLALDFSHNSALTLALTEHGPVPELVVHVPFV
jgi:hypothetical protein